MAQRARIPVKIVTEGFRWAALRTSANAEFGVVEALEEKGYPAYCPTGAKWVFWEHGRKTREKQVRFFPVFSRYVFCGLSTGKQASRYMVDKIDGVLGDKSGPIFVPPAALRRINDLEVGGEWDTARSWREKSPFKKGDAVSVVGGAFAGFPATVDALESECRIWVLLEMFGQATRTAMDPCQIAQIAV